MKLVIEPIPCDACGLDMHPLLAIKCPHCGEIQGPPEGMDLLTADLNKRLGWDISS